MRKIKLGDVIDVKRGTSLAGSSYSEFGTKIRLTLGNFCYPENGFKNNTSKTDIYYTGEVKPEFIMKKGDIITPLTEQVRGLLGNTATIPEDNLYIQSGDIGKIIIKNSIDKRFVYYLVSSPIVKKQLDFSSQQTKIRHTSPDKLKDCIAYIPDPFIQKKISSLLDGINNKIQKNNNICNELESVAKAIYNYWFLQFDFPDKDGKPYNSSGGKMVWNEELKREIPDGWKVLKLKEIENNIITGKTPSTMHEEYFNGNIPFITIEDIRKQMYICNTDRKLTSIGADSQKNKYIPKNSLCISCIASLGEFGFTTEESQTNQQINTIVFNEEYNREFLYFYLYNYFKVASAKSGNIFSNMNKEEFSDIKIIYPLPEVLEVFHQKIMSMFDAINCCCKENQELTSMRDFLLPMLMNGQISFKN